MQEAAANAQIKQQLHADSGEISLSLSLFILLQGNFPVIWSAISEIKGRKVRILAVLTLWMSYVNITEFSWCTFSPSHFLHLDLQLWPCQEVLAWSSACVFYK